MQPSNLCQKKRRENNEASSSSSSQKKRRENAEASSISLYDHKQLPCQFRVFLSHSGKQKYFVERLFEELQRAHVHAFFDRDRDSLRPGDKVPERIMEAARQCEVAVLVLSADFVGTKWPMMELAAFVKRANEHPQSITILPLFYELSVEELSKGLELKTWMGKWEDLAQSEVDWQGKTIDAHSWHQALEDVRRCSGREFFKSPKIQLDYKVESEYIAEIVTDICRLIKSPDVSPDDSDVQGKQRLCKVIDSEFDNILTSSASQVAILGMYGMPGCGKSTLCQCLCNELYTQFPANKLYYLELPSEVTGSMLVDVLKDLVRRLTGWSDALFRGNPVSTMRQVRHLIKSREPPGKVFLAIDNVWKASKEAAEAILGFKFKAGSKVMFTSRDKGLLESLMRILPVHVIPTPCLNVDEAVSVLLHSALGPGYVLPPRDQDIALEIVSLLDYCPGNTTKMHHHPLAMRIVGDMLGRYGKEPSSWRLKVDLMNLKNNMIRDECEVIMDLIEMSYSELSDRLKRVFLDVIFVMFRQSRAAMEDVRLWLSILQKQDTSTIQDQLKQLMQRSFIGPQVEGQFLQIHDLFREFGKNQLVGDPRYLIITEDCRDGPETLEAAGKRSVERVAVYNGDLEKANLEGYSKVEALVLKDCEPLRELNLRGMKSLAILEVEGCSRLQVVEGELSSLAGRLEKLRWVGSEGGNIEAILNHDDGQWPMQLLVGGTNIIPGVGRFSALQDLTLSGRLVHDVTDLRHCLKLKNLHMTVCEEIPELGNLTKLESLRLSTHVDYFGSRGRLRRPIGALDLSGCSSLQDVVVHLTRFPLQVNLGSLEKLTRCSLIDYERKGPQTDIDFTGCPNLEVVVVRVRASPNLYSLGKLQDVDLGMLQCEGPQIMACLPAAGETLENLSLSLTTGSVPSFGHLTALTRLSLAYQMEEFPDLSPLVWLEELFVKSRGNEDEEHRSLMIWDLSCLTYLTRLIHIDIACKLVGELWLGSCTSLLILDLSECENLRKLVGLGQLKSLLLLDLLGCKHLTSLVGLDQLLNLRALLLGGCETVNDLNDHKWTRLSRLRRFDLGGWNLPSEDTLVEWIVSASSPCPLQKAAAKFLVRLLKVEMVLSRQDDGDEEEEVSLQDDDWQISTNSKRKKRLSKRNFGRELNKKKTKLNLRFGKSGFGSGFVILDNRLPTISKISLRGNQPDEKEETMPMRERLAPRLIPRLLHPNMDDEEEEEEEVEEEVVNKYIVPSGSLNHELTKLLLWLCWVDGQPYEPSISILHAHVVTSPLHINLKDLYFLGEEGACGHLIGVLAAVAASKTHSTSLQALFDRFHFREYVDVVSYSPSNNSPQLTMICLLHFVLSNHRITLEMENPIPSIITTLTNKMRLGKKSKMRLGPNCASAIGVIGSFKDVNFALNALQKFGLRIRFEKPLRGCFFDTYSN